MFKTERLEHPLKAIAGMEVMLFLYRYNSSNWDRPLNAFGFIEVMPKSEKTIMVKYGSTLPYLVFK
jgi:hypothetical protein